MVFLSCFSQFSEQGNMRAEIISEIRAQLEACQRDWPFKVKFEISKWENPRVLSFSLTSQTMLDQSVDFDVLPAFDALGEAPRPRPEKEGEEQRSGTGVGAVRGAANPHLSASWALQTCVFITASLQNVRRKLEFF